VVYFGWHIHHRLGCALSGLKFLANEFPPELAAWGRNLNVKKEKTGHEKSASAVSCDVLCICLDGDGV
jgi:hypothetical protein